MTTSDPDGVEVPPIRRDARADDAMPDPPRWPKVVGILSVVIGGLWVLLGGCGMLFMVMGSSFQKMLPEPMPEVMLPNSGQMLLAGVGLVLSVFLLIAGIVLLMRNPSARFLHLGYALVNLPILALSTHASYLQQQRVAAWAAENPSSIFAQQQNSTLNTVILIATVALGAAWPVFCIIWFGFVKRHPEDITGPDLPPAA